MSKNYDMCMIGLGPVGTVSAVCIAKQGFNVIGVDIDKTRVAAFNDNKAPFVEPGVNDLINEVLNAGNFRATTDFKSAVQQSKIIMIAVGTPTPESGVPNLSFLENVSKSIGEAFKEKNPQGAIVVVRSTVPPGTMRSLMAPIIEQNSGTKAGVDFHIASNPEFLREGKAIDDFFVTSRIVVGADSEEVANDILALYKDVEGERMATTVETGEFAKYVDNTWHALKVAYANEIGRTVLGFGGSVEDTTRIFLADDKLNISKYYLNPGFAFGGSCLPKDTRGLNHFAKKHGVNTPIIASIMASNQEQIKQGINAILATGARQVGFLGVAFKEHVDDLREAPALYVASALIKQGIKVMAHDPAFKEGDKIDLPYIDNKLEILALDNIKNADAVVQFHKIDEYNQLSTELEATKKLINLTEIIQKTEAPLKKAA